jgi:hypothetical protein
MTEIRYHRLKNQHLLNSRLKDPIDVLKSLVALQSQDYSGAKWALGQRTISATDTIIEQAFTEGQILRTHLMRPTWHFVAREDIGWLLTLTAPRVSAMSASYFRKAGLDTKTTNKINRAFVKALEGGRQLTRDELREVCKRAGIEPGDPVRMGHIMLRAELDGVVCSGARKGKQFTYALLIERAPNGRRLEEDEALGELSKRYFETRGPATLRDFVWWSGLTMSQVKRGVDIARVKSEVINDTLYWSSATKKKVLQGAEGSAHLLPPYDEYFISYKDRSAVMHPRFGHAGTAEKIIFDSPFTLDGLVVGGWRRPGSAKNTSVLFRPFLKLSKEDKDVVQVALRRYFDFLGIDASVAGWEFTS